MFLLCINRIFLVPNLLTIQQCRDLIIKGGNHFTRSTKSGGALEGTALMKKKSSRTSHDVRVPFREVPHLQDIFSEVLKTPVSQMEPLKLIRYKKDQFFKAHHDEGASLHLGRRLVSLLVYLNTCDTGGETQFTKYGLKVKPRAGMGLIHFPSYLSTAGDLYPAECTEGAKVEVAISEKGVVSTGTVVIQKDENTVVIEKDGSGKRIERQVTETKVLQSMCGLRDERVKHEGMAALEEKFVASQVCLSLLPLPLRCHPPPPPLLPKVVL